MSRGRALVRMACYSCFRSPAYSRQRRSFAHGFSAVQTVGVRIGEPAVVCNMLELELQTPVNELKDLKS